MIREKGTPTNPMVDTPEFRAISFYFSTKLTENKWYLIIVWHVAGKVAKKTFILDGDSKFKIWM